MNCPLAQQRQEVAMGELEPLPQQDSSEASRAIITRSISTTPINQGATNSSRVAPTMLIRTKGSRRQ